MNIIVKWNNLFIEVDKNYINSHQVSYIAIPERTKENVNLYITKFYVSVFDYYEREFGLDILDAEIYKTVDEHKFLRVFLHQEVPINKLCELPKGTTVSAVEGSDEDAYTHVELMLQIPI